MKFKQLCSHKDVLFAVDENGQVYRNVGENKWKLYGNDEFLTPEEQAERKRKQEEAVQRAKENAPDWADRVSY